MGLVLGMTDPAAAQGDLGADEIERISRAVVRIVALQGGEPVGTGSGTVVAADGLIYTNRHVIEGADDFSIETLADPNELPVPTFRASLVGYALDVDFAVLQVDRDPAGQPLTGGALDLAVHTDMASTSRRGDDIFVFGYPGIGGGYLALTEGTVTTIRNGTMNDERMPVWYQTDAQISPGNSGGLAVNGRGEMVGIPTTVLTEDRTGGRLGGILALDAVRAALEGGLERDASGITNGTTAPVIEDGRLDVAQAPTFGEMSLEAGFTPDPYTLEVVSGGEVAVDYLGGDCTGFAAVPAGRASAMDRQHDRAAGVLCRRGWGRHDVAHQPSGRHVGLQRRCGHPGSDAGAGRPRSGPVRHLGRELWRGGLRDGGSACHRARPRPCVRRADRAGNPGRSVLRRGDPRGRVPPDPNESEIVAGGPVDASYLGGECVGHAAAAPDVRLQWSGSSDELGIAFAADGGEDTSLLVNLPDGTWVCNDDASGLDPAVLVSDPSPGQYDIWVASYERGQTIPGTLRITELALEDLPE